jgi:hypothetical protein
MQPQTPSTTQGLTKNSKHSKAMSHHVSNFFALTGIKVTVVVRFLLLLWPSPLITSLSAYPIHLPQLDQSSERNLCIQYFLSAPCNIEPPPWFFDPVSNGCRQRSAGLCSADGGGFVSFSDCLLTCEMLIVSDKGEYEKAFKES